MSYAEKLTAALEDCVSFEIKQCELDPENSAAWKSTVEELQGNMKASGLAALSVELWKKFGNDPNIRAATAGRRNLKQAMEQMVKIVFATSLLASEDNPDDFAKPWKEQVGQIVKDAGLDTRDVVTACFMEDIVLDDEDTAKKKVAAMKVGKEKAQLKAYQKERRMAKQTLKFRGQSTTAVTGFRALETVTDEIRDRLKEPAYCITAAMAGDPTTYGKITVDEEGRVTVTADYTSTSMAFREFDARDKGNSDFVAKFIKRVEKGLEMMIGKHGRNVHFMDVDLRAEQVDANRKRVKKLRELQQDMAKVTAQLKKTNTGTKKGTKKGKKKTANLQQKMNKLRGILQIMNTLAPAPSTQVGQSATASALGPLLLSLVDDDDEEESMSGYTTRATSRATSRASSRGRSRSRKEEHSAATKNAFDSDEYYSWAHYDL